ncbi:MAG: sugar ABC transporter substrate-binding protein, partial [Clostridiales bacterium]|nr:sugar ABC transporter substrate-binding protein [Clostridiales bacterium]
EVISKALDHEGEIAIIRGPLETSINKVRRDAVCEVINKKKKMTVIAEIEADTKDEVVYTSTKEALETYGNLSGIIVLTGGVLGAVKAVEEMGLAGDVKIVCFDYDNDVMELIKRGVIHTAIGQDPFGQGHDPIISMYNYLVTGEKPDSVCYTRTEVINNSNVSI